MNIQKAIYNFFLLLEINLHLLSFHLGCPMVNIENFDNKQLTNISDIIALRTRVTAPFSNCLVVTPVRCHSGAPFRVAVSKGAICGH